MRKVIFEIIIFLFFCFGAVFATIGSTGCTREVVVYRPVPVQLPPDVILRVHESFEEIRKAEAEIKQIEKSHKVDDLISNLEHSTLIKGIYLDAFLKKDHYLAQNALLFRIILQEYFGISPKIE